MQLGRRIGDLAQKQKTTERHQSTDSVEWNSRNTVLSLSSELVWVALKLAAWTDQPQAVHQQEFAGNDKDGTSAPKYALWGYENSCHPLY